VPQVVSVQNPFLKPSSYEILCAVRPG